MERGLRTYIEARGLDPAATEAEAQAFLTNLDSEPRTALASQRKVISAALLLSVVTVEEMPFGLTWWPNPRVRGWLDGFLAGECEVLPVTETILRCESWTPFGGPVVPEV